MHISAFKCAQWAFQIRINIIILLDAIYLQKHWFNKAKVNGRLDAIETKENLVNLPNLTKLKLQF